MNWLIGAGEATAGVVILSATAIAIALLRPGQGLQERTIVSFPGAWIVVGLLLTFSFGTSVALIALGTGLLR